MDPVPRSKRAEHGGALAGWLASWLHCTALGIYDTGDWSAAQGCRQMEPIGEASHRY